MPPRFYFEFRPPHPLKSCPDCGDLVQSVTRYINADDAAYAVCHASFHPQSAEKKIMFALSIGDWGSSSKTKIPTSRFCFTVAFIRSPEVFGFSMRDADENPWRNIPLLGRMLSRAEALSDPQVGNIWVILDFLIEQDPVLKPYLVSSS